MSAGIPGTGISVFFYVLSVLVMVLRAMKGTHQRKNTEKWKIVRLQLRILGGAALSVGLTAWFTGCVLTEIFGLINGSIDLFGAFPISLVSPGLMLIVILSVEVLSLLTRKKGTLGS